MGEAGVTRCLDVIRKELDITMALCGLRDIRQVDRRIVVPGTYPIVTAAASRSRSPRRGRRARLRGGRSASLNGRRVNGAVMNRFSLVRLVVVSVATFFVGDRRVGAGRVSDADAGRRRPEGLPLRVRRDAARPAAALPHRRHAAARRARRASQRGADPARHRRHRRAVHPPGVRGRAVRRRAALLDASKLLHRAARRHRPRRIEQAERRPARALPALRLPRHGRGAAPACSSTASA